MCMLHQDRFLTTRSASRLRGLGRCYYVHSNIHVTPQFSPYKYHYLGMLQTRHLHSRTNIPTSIIVFSEDKHTYLGDMSYSVFYRVVYKLNGFTAARMANSVLRPLHVLCKHYFSLFLMKVQLFTFLPYRMM